ncbi:hypothetical protein BN2476_1020011 [Paraburkholderia piptadeniae]|uniref:Uncharacterized protein n=1 Tax=Paraburkholderia piptadeniae TaxID=1701573 RepID=A0A1N7SW40_9BURK|nr:hypothetical protein BN2476_1020011 [Paraburkholderia piptadeniae]
MEAKDYDGRPSTHRGHRQPLTLSAQELATLLRLRNVSVLTDVERGMSLRYRKQGWSISSHQKTATPHCR